LYGITRYFPTQIASFSDVKARFKDHVNSKAVECDCAGRNHTPPIRTTEILSRLTSAQGGWCIRSPGRSYCRLAYSARARGMKPSNARIRVSSRGCVLRNSIGRPSPRRACMRRNAARKKLLCGDHIRRAPYRAGRYGPLRAPAHENAVTLRRALHQGRRHQARFHATAAPDLPTPYRGPRRPPTSAVVPRHVRHHAVRPRGPLRGRSP
jgi:hypothetical protein